MMTISRCARRHLLAVLLVYIGVCWVAVPALASPYSDAVMAQSPVGYWRFEGDASDFSGNGHHGLEMAGSGTLTAGTLFPALPAGAGPVFAAEPSNRALNLTHGLDYPNGLAGPPYSQYVRIAPSDANYSADEAAFDRNIGDSWTMMGWVKVSSYGSTGGILMAKQLDDAAGLYTGFSAFITGTGRVAAYLQAGGNYVEYVSADMVPLNLWTFVAVTFNGSDPGNPNGFTTYIDGFATGGTASGGALGSSILQNTPFQIGSRYDVTPAHEYHVPFQGMIDEAAFFTSELDSTAIADVYAAAAALPQEDQGAVPEPATMGLVALTALALGRRRRPNR